MNWSNRMTIPMDKSAKATCRREMGLSDTHA